MPTCIVWPKSASPQQRIEHVQVVRHPDIVVAEIGDETAPCALQGSMAMDFALAGALGKIEEMNAAIGGGQFGNDRTGRMANAVADDEQLEVLQALLLHARDRMPQRLDVIVRRDQYRGNRHGRAIGVWPDLPPLIQIAAAAWRSQANHSRATTATEPLKAR